MSDNIIDFNERKREKDEANRQEIDFSPEAMLERLSSMPENALVNSVVEPVSAQMLKLMFLTDIAVKATEALQNANLEPDNFIVNDFSVDRFLYTPLTVGGDEQWNGPWFDWEADDAVVRLTTTLQVDEETAEGHNISIIMNLLRLAEGEDHWMIYTGDDWLEGPPAEFFDLIDDDWEDEDDWDDEDDDEDGEDWDDDDYWDPADDESVCTLVLKPTLIAALLKADIITIDQLREATDEQLLAIDGIDAKALARIREALDD